MARSPWSRWVGVSIALVLCFGPLAAQEKQEKKGGRQRGGFGGGGFGGPGAMMGQRMSKLGLLRIEQVQAEIKVTPEQKEKIAALQPPPPERGGFGDLGQLSQEERQKRFAEEREKREKATAEAEKKLVGVLEAEQEKRLDEILLQQQGVDGLVTAPVVASLKLKDEQVEKIRSALTTRDEEMRKLMPGRGGPGGGGGDFGGPGGGGGFQEMREQSEKIRKKADETGFAVLSSEQREAFEKLKGKPFELDRRALFGGRGGPGGEGRGPGQARGGPGQGRGPGGGGERRRPPDDDK